MRITILTQYFLPEMGAPQSRLFELTRGFIARGWDVDVIAAMPNYPTGKIFSSYRGKFLVKEQLEGILIHRYWIYASNSGRVFPRILSMLSFSFTILFSAGKVRRRKPDFVLVESPPLTLAFSAWLIARISGSKMIMNVSDLWPLSAKELGAISEGMLYRLIEKLEHFLYRNSALCVGQSAEIVRYISSRTDIPAYLFRNGVDTLRFGSNERNVDGVSSPIRIIYAGLLGVAQGILELCKAIDFGSLGVEFHIFGTGAEKEEIEKFLAMHPQRGIKYKGVMSRDQMPEVLQEYDASLVTLVKNIYGAVPSKIYEAMAAGLPILFSGDGEGACIVREHHVGWVNPPQNWDALASNIKYFSGLSRGVRADMKGHCRRIARDFFDRSRQIDDFHLFLSKYMPRPRKTT